MVLNLFTPTKEREFTYYDRCAIALDEVEMKAARLRIKVEILATPLYRSQNLRYPYYKEFYGYAQTFFQNIYVGEVPIHYTESFIYDYWNQHGVLAHQLTTTLQRLKANLVAHSQLSFSNSTIAPAEVAQALIATLNAIRSLEVGFTPSSVLGTDGSVVLPGSVNTFNSPINLLRFRFDIGTIFKVVLQSWSLPTTDDGNSLGNSITSIPYDTDNPNGTTPTPSGARDPNNQPYGASPPPQSPIDPSLDPNDFNNPPPPPVPPGFVNLQGWRTVAISGVQGAATFITCPGASLGAAYPPAANIQEPITNLGVRLVPISETGIVTRANVIAVFPEFPISQSNIVARDGCGVTGTIP